MTQREYQMIVNKARQRAGYRPCVSVVVRDLSCGQGYHEEKIIMMPYWVDKYDVAYQIYYVIHELCHCIVGVAHSAEFKMFENTMLGSWGIRITRKSVYPRRLYFMGVRCRNTPADAEILSPPVVAKGKRPLKRAAAT